MYNLNNRRSCTRETVENKSLFLVKLTSVDLLKLINNIFQMLRFNTIKKVGNLVIGTNST